MSGMFLVLASLVVSNGVSVAHCDGSGRVDSLRAHLYAARDAGTPTVERMGALYFGVRSGGTNAWLDGDAPDASGYLGDGGVATMTWERDGLRVTEYLFASFATEAPHLVALLEVTNTGSAALADAAIFSLEQTVAGGDESATWTGGAFEERGDVLLLHRPLGALAHHAIDPRAQVDAGGHLADADTTGPMPSLAVGFEWALDGLVPGASRTVGVIVGVRDDGDRAALDAGLAAVASDPAQALADARADWDDFFARAAEPPGLDGDERAVYRRSLALLRMAQVREAGAPAGQIVAALYPLAAGRAWVRDEAYAARALVRAGLLDEARAALAFVLAAGAGTYQSEIGEPYAVSVLRQRGDGSEESDDTGAGPLVGIDGFGLVLGAVNEYVQASGDTAFASDRAEALFDLTATVLTHRIDVNDTLLVRPDNSVWNGDRRKYTFSQAATVWGLRAAVRLASGDARADSYRGAAESVCRRHRPAPGQRRRADRRARARRRAARQRRDAGVPLGGVAARRRRRPRHPRRCQPGAAAARRQLPAQRRGARRGVADRGAVAGDGQRSRGQRRPGGRDLGRRHCPGPDARRPRRRRRRGAGDRPGRRVVRPGRLGSAGGRGRRRVWMRQRRPRRRCAPLARRGRRPAPSAPRGRAVKHYLEDRRSLCSSGATHVPDRSPPR